MRLTGRPDRADRARAPVDQLIAGDHCTSTRPSRSNRGRVDHRQRRPTATRPATPRTATTIPTDREHGDQRGGEYRRGARCRCVVPPRDIRLPQPTIATGRRPGARCHRRCHRATVPHTANTARPDDQGGRAGADPPARCRRLPSAISRTATAHSIRAAEARPTHHDQVQPARPVRWDTAEALIPSCRGQLLVVRPVTEAPAKIRRIDHRAIQAMVPTHQRRVDRGGVDGPSVPRRQERVPDQGQPGLRLRRRGLFDRLARPTSPGRPECPQSRRAS